MSRPLAECEVYDFLTNSPKKRRPRLPVLLIRSPDKRRKLQWAGAYVPTAEDHVPLDGYGYEDDDKHEPEVRHVPVFSRHLQRLYALSLKPNVYPCSSLLSDQTSWEDGDLCGPLVNVHPAEAFSLVRMGLWEIDAYERLDDDVLGGYWLFKAVRG